LANKLAFIDKPTPLDVVDALKSLCRARAGLKIEIDLTKSVFAKFGFDHFYNLAGFDLSECVFSQTSGYGAVFDGCTFSGTTFRYLSFHQANLRGATFTSCTFTDVDFEDVNLRNSSFWDCEFKNCKFANCDVSGVEFYVDAGDVKLPFEPELLAECWAWKNNLPKLGTKFSGTLYDPGTDGKERVAFANAREKRRLAGENYSEYSPNAKLKVAQPA
jgi:uncharacterized protein YjbI with pentapeptide repeats